VSRIQGSVFQIIAINLLPKVLEKILHSKKNNIFDNYFGFFRTTYIYHLKAPDLVPHGDSCSSLGW